MFRLTEEQQSTVDMVRKLVEREIAPRAAELDRQHAFPEHARDLFAQLGLLNPLLPAEFDGPGMGMMTMALVLEEVQPAGKKSMPGKAFLSGARDWES